MSDHRRRSAEDEEHISQIPEASEVDEHISQIPDTVGPPGNGPRSKQVDAAIQAAFADAFEDDAPSVLHRIGERGGAMPHIHLRDPNGNDGPILRPAADDGHEGGRYRVIGEVARGGVGTVLQVRDTDLGRDVAVKVLHDRYANNPDVVQRFIEEAQVGGQLQHPGVVPVYELGVQKDGRPFFAMKLVKGETLSSLLSKRRTPAEGRGQFMQIFQKICQTMAYAHARKVIHRDLKPSNVMVGSFGEVQVVDWGFAKVLGQGGVDDETRSRRRHIDVSVIETVRTGSSGAGSGSQTGAVLGTPAYMPPEQAKGDIENLDERTDVFALGAILCEILIGRPPYQKGETNLVVQAARAELGNVFKQLDQCGADPYVIKVAKACLSPKAKDRPRNAGELEKAVTRYLQSREDKARKAEIKASAAEARAAAEAKSRKRIVLAAAVACGALLIGVVGIVLAGQAGEERMQQTARLVEAELAKSEEQARDARAQSDGGRATWDSAIALAEAAKVLAVQEEADEVTLDRVKRTIASLEDERNRAGLRAKRSAADGLLRRQLLDFGVRARQPAVYDTEREHARLARAVAEWGLRLGDPEEGARHIRMSAVRADVTEALDLWRLQSAPQSKDRAKLDRLLVALDTTGPLQDIRLATSKDMLRSKIGQIRFTPETILLSDALAEAGDTNNAAQLLARAATRETRDPRLQTALACRLAAVESPDWAAIAEAASRASRLLGATTALQLLEARALVRSEETERALGLVRALRSEDEGAEDIVALLTEAIVAHARTLETRNAHDAHIALWEEAIELQPNVPEYRASLIDAFVAAGRLDDAIEAARADADRWPDDWKTLSRLANVLMDAVYKRGELVLGSEALTSQELVLQLCPRDQRNAERVQFARWTVDAERHQDAEPLLAELVEEQPQEIELRVLLGRAHYGLGQPNQAIEQLEVATSLENSSTTEQDRFHLATGRAVRAACLVMTRNETGAAEDLERAADRLDALAPTAASPERMATVRLFLAERFHQLKDWSSALEQSVAAVEAAPDDAQAHRRRAEALRMLNRPDDALDAIEVAAQLGVPLPDVNLQKALILMQKGRADLVLASIAGDPHRPTYLHELGLVAGRRGMDDVARVALARAVARVPSRWDWRIDFARLLTTSNDPEVKDPELALEVLEDLPEGQIGWARVSDAKRIRFTALVELNRLDEAADLTEEVLDWSWSNISRARTHQMVGRFAEQRNDWAEAQKRNQRAAELIESGASSLAGVQSYDRTRAGVHYDTARFEFRIGDFDGALASLDRTVSLVKASSLAETAPGVVTWYEIQTEKIRALSLSACGRYDEAAQSALQAWKLSNQDNVHASFRAAAAIGQAHVEIDRRDYKAAAGHLSRAREIGHENDLRFAYRVKMNLLSAEGQTFAALGRLDEAQNAFDELLELADEHDYEYARVVALCLRSRWLGRDVDEAAAKLEAFGGSPISRTSLWYALWKASGDRRHRKAAKAAYDEVLARNDEAFQASLKSTKEYRELFGE